MLNFKREKKPDPEGSHLLATILVVYPEVSTVSYEPEDGMLRLSFAMTGKPEQEAFQQFAQMVIDSIEAYHHLEGFSNAKIEMYIEGAGTTSFLHVKRDIASLSRGELSIIAELVEERFRDELILDGPEGTVDTDFLIAQEDHLEQVLGMVRQLKIPDRLVGIREHERVVVYAR